MTRSQIASLKPCLFIYDIPENVPVLPNPSPRLYPIAIRLQYSGWVIAEADIPATYFAQMEARFQAWRKTERGQAWALTAGARRWIARHGDIGVKWNAVPFDANAAHLLLPMCEESIRAEIALKMESARATYANEEARIEAEYENGEMTIAERKRRLRVYKRQMNLVVKRCATLLRDVQSAASRFGVNLGNAAQDAMAIVNGIDTAIKTRMRQFVELTDELARALGDDNAAVRAARADQMPDYILADYAEDNNLDATALRVSMSAAERAATLATDPE